MVHEYRTPGQLIEGLLEEHGWTKRVLALVLNYDESALGKIIKGKKSVDAELALMLGEVFEIPAERFLELQHKYDLAQAIIVARPDPKRRVRARLFGTLPTAEMVKRAWLAIDDLRDVDKVEEALLSFFKVGSLDEIEAPAHAAKKTEAGKPATLIQTAWLRRVRQIAEEMLVPRFTTAGLRDALKRCRTLLASAEEARHVPRALTEAGVRFLVVESLPGAKIDGVCMWLDDASPVIALSMRLDRIDNFWFVLRHEIEHVLHGHGRGQPKIDTEVETAEGNEDEEEKIANAAAAEFCVPQSPLRAFIQRKNPYFAEQDVIGFARTHQIHPGLVAGQLQRKTNRYDRFRPHQVKIRSIVAPSATVDGWGDVAPVEL